MREILLVLVALTIGGAAGWFWATRQMRSLHAQQADELKRQAAGAVERVKHELAGRIQQRDQELIELRSRLEAEVEQAQNVQSRLRADHEYAQKETRQLKDQNVRLSESLKVFSAELTSIHSQTLDEVDRLIELGAGLERITTAYQQAVQNLKSRTVAAKQRVHVHAHPQQKAGTPAAD